MLVVEPDGCTLGGYVKVGLPLTLPTMLVTVTLARINCRS
jgi:hypothetical protein